MINWIRILFVFSNNTNISFEKDILEKNVQKIYQEIEILAKNISKNIIIEGLLLLYFVFGLASAYLVTIIGGAEKVDFGLVPFHLMLVIVTIV